MKHTILKEIILKNKLNYFILFIMILLLSILNSSLVFIYYYFGNHLDLTNIKIAAIMFFAFWTTKIILYYIIQIIAFKSDMILKKQLNTNIIKRIYHEKYSEIEANGKEYYTTIYTRDVNTVTVYAREIFVPMVEGVLTFLFALVMGFYFSILLTIVILVFAFISTLVLKAYKDKIMSSERKSMYSHENLNKLLLSIKKNGITTKIYGLEKQLQKLVFKIWEKLKLEENRKIKMSASMRALNIGVGMISNTFWLALALFLVATNHLAIGTLLAYMALSSTFNWPFFEFPFLQSKLFSIKNAYNNLTSYEETIDFTNFSFEKTAFQKLELCDLSYAYQNKKIKYPNITIKKGEWIAIMGESGVGKTTLIKLLLGLYAPTDGYFKVNGQKVDQVYSYINLGYLPQKIHFFINETYGYNLNLDNEILNPLQQDIFANARFSFSLSDNTSDKKIDNFSGGEMKRLGLIRAFTKTNDILILDEFSAGLDEATTNEIITILRNLNLTILFITHDKNVIDMCDRKIKLHH